MTVSPLDWAIVAAYFALSIGFGLYFTRRGGESLVGSPGTELEFAL